jgi:hypothetical protein
LIFFAQKFQFKVQKHCKTVYCTYAYHFAYYKQKSLTFLFKEINALKRQLNPENTASSKKRKAEYQVYIKLTFSSDEGEEYLFTSSKPFRSSKTKLAKSSHPIDNQ